MSESPSELALKAELGLIPESDIPKPVAKLISLDEERPVLFERFLTAYRATGTIRAACLQSKVSRDSIAKWRKEDPAYQLQFETAEREFTESLEEIAHQRAAEKSDLLLMFTLKKRDPSYRENFKMEHSGEVAIRVIRYADDLAAQAAAAVPEIAAPVAPPSIEAHIAREQ